MNRLDYYFGQKVSETELDKGFDYAETALRAVVAENNLTGVCYGLEVTAQLVPDMTVAVSAGGGYTHDGNPVRLASPVAAVDLSLDHNSVPTAVAAPGNEKYVAVFLLFDRALSDPRVDDNAITVYFERAEYYRFKITQSAEAPTGTAVPVGDDPDAGVRLCDVLLTFGQSTISTGDIKINGREDVFTAQGWGGTPSPVNIREGTAREAFNQLQYAINLLYIGGSPIPASNVTYDGGAAWPDGTTNPATDVEAQLDKIVTDLAANTDPAGAKKIGTRSRTSGLLSITGGTVDAQLFELLGYVAAAGSAAGVSYAGGGTWADGTTNPATTVELQLDKIVSDLAASTGTAKVGGAAIASSPSSLSAGTLAAQISALLGLINGRSRLTGNNTHIGNNSFQGKTELISVSDLDENALAETDHAPLTYRKLLFAFGGQGPSAVLRLYMEGDNAGAVLGFSVTVNMKYSGASTTWTRDVASLVPMWYRFGVYPTPGLLVARFPTGSAASNFDENTDLDGSIELRPGNAATPPATYIDGDASILVGIGEVTIHSDNAFYAGLAGASLYRFQNNFPKKFPSTPSSFSLTNVSDTNGTSSAGVLTVSGCSVDFNATTATQMARSNVDCVVSLAYDGAMPLVAYVPGSSVTQRCVSCKTEREFPVSSLRLGTPSSPTHIQLPDCSCGTRETLVVPADTTEDPRAHGTLFDLHRRVVGALGVELGAPQPPEALTPEHLAKFFRVARG